MAERWNITPLTAYFTLETKQHVYALSAPLPLCLCLFFHPNYIFTLPVNLSFTQPPCFSPSIPEDRVIIWAVCSPPAPMNPSFPSSPPVRTCCPPPNPPSLSHPLNLSSRLGEGPLGPQQYPSADLCKFVSQEPHQATQAHIGQTHTTSWKRYRRLASVALFSFAGLHTCRHRRAHGTGKWM